ncbi:hypothetical protein ACLKA6_001207 [Drosophila palustris]
MLLDVWKMGARLACFHFSRLSLARATAHGPRAELLTRQIMLIRWHAIVEGNPVMEGEAKGKGGNSKCLTLRNRMLLSRKSNENAH